MSRGAHSDVGASSSERWMACPGSVAAIRQLGCPYRSSVYADEGSTAHKVAEWCLRLMLDASFFRGDEFTKNGRIFTVDDDMVAAVQVYVDYIRALISIPGAEWALESHVDLSWLRPGMFGTTDFTAYLPEQKKLIVVDYKHGKGVPVEVVGNSQFRYYGLDATRKYKAQFVQLVVVQPRAPHPHGPIRSELLLGYELLKWGDEVLGPAVDRVREPGAPRVVGPHCRWCGALSVCPTVHEESQKQALVEFEPYDAFVPSDIDILAKVLRAKPFVTAYLNAVEREIRRALSEGRHVPGWKLVRGAAHRKWSDALRAENFLLDLRLDPDDFHEPMRLISPAQVETLIKSRLSGREERREAIRGLREFWEKPPGLPRLVPEDSPGEALGPGEPRELLDGEFEPVEDDESWV